MSDCIQQKSKISEHASEACIFCKIIAGEIPCSKVYEDDSTVAFVDIAPINKGHMLVIPKEHHETLLDMPEDLMCKVLVVVKKIASAVKKATDCDGFNIGMNNYKAAGQLVPHAHFHVIPRFSGDGLKHWPAKKYEEGEEKEYAEKIKRAL